MLLDILKYFCLALFLHSRTDIVVTLLYKKIKQYQSQRFLVTILCIFDMFSYWSTIYNNYSGDGHFLVCSQHPGTVGVL